MGDCRADSREFKVHQRDKTQNRNEDRLNHLKTKGGGGTAKEPHRVERNERCSPWHKNFNVKVKCKIRFSWRVYELVVPRSTKISVQYKDRK